MADVYIDIGAQLDSASLENIKSQISGMAGNVKVSLGGRNFQLDKDTANIFVRDLAAMIRTADPGPMRQSLQQVMQQVTQGLKAADIVQPTNAGQEMSNAFMKAIFGVTPEGIARAYNSTIQQAEKLINRETIAGASAFKTSSLADQQKILGLGTVQERQQAIQALGREQLANPLSTGAQAANAALARTQAQLQKNAAEQIRIGTEFYGKLPPEQQAQLRAAANGDPAAFVKQVSTLASGFVGNPVGTADQRAQLRFLQDNAKQNLVAQRKAILDGSNGAKIFDGLSDVEKASLMSTVDPSQFPELLRTIGANAGGPAGVQQTLQQQKYTNEEARIAAATLSKNLRFQQKAVATGNLGAKILDGYSPLEKASILSTTTPQDFGELLRTLGSGLDPKQAQDILAAQRYAKLEASTTKSILADRTSASKDIAKNIAIGEQVYGLMSESERRIVRDSAGNRPGGFGEVLGNIGKELGDPATRASALADLKLARIQAQEAEKAAKDITKSTQAVEDEKSKSPKQKQQSESGQILRTYQKAAAFYQAGNIASALGLPGGQQLSLMGSTMQALAPTSLAGAAPAIGLGLVGVQMGKQAIEDTLKAYMPVEQQFMRVQTLTQTSKAEVKNLEQQVRSLSTSTGLTQEDLAKSLYYISSSGFKGNDAFTILNATVKASAAGLGDVAGVADIVTSMMNAYGIKASGAFTVTDKLITAIREGKAEPEQFARSLGQVLPIAREAGIGLDEVLSSVSAITLQGFSAPQAITSVRQAISNLISPSKEAAKELDLFYGEGKGIITVQAKLQTEGFQATLQDLYQKTGGNLQSLDAIFGNIRGLSGVLALANGEFAKMDDITKQIANSSGVTRSAFEDATKTTQSEIKKMEAAWEDLKIQLGKGIAPIVIPIITRLADDLALGNRASGGDSGFDRTKRVYDDLVQQLKSPGSSFMASGAAAMRLYSRDNPLLAFLESGGFGSGAQEQYQNRDIADQFQEYYNKANPISKRLIGEDWRKKLKDAGVLPQPIGEIGKNGFWNPNAPDLSGGAFQDYMMGLSGGGGSTVISRTSDVFITGEKVRFNKAVAEWGAERQKAIGMIEKLNENLANAIFSGLDQMQGKAEGYDAFFSKLSDIDSKLAASPDFVQVFKENGKSTTLSAQQKEDEKIRTLKNQVSIEEQKNKIREARKPSKDANQNVLRTLQDNLYDEQLNAKKQQLSDLEKGQAGRSVITVQNEADKKALEERRILLEEYDKQTYDIVKTQFQAGLLGSADDPEGFNFLLKNGGDLLSKFANNAGLFKTSGFAAAIAEAALQMKYLRGPDGKYLKGEDFAVGFGEYSNALEQFRGKLKDMAPYLSGDQKMTVPIAVDMKLVPVGTTDLTNVGEVRRKVTAGGERDETGKRVKTDVSTLVTQGIDVTTPEGQVKQLMKNMGFDIESGLQASFKINMELASPSLAGDVELIKAKLEGLDELKNGIIIPVGIELAKTGLNPENIVDKDNKATLQEMFDNLLPKEGETGKNNITWTVPLSLVAPSSNGVDTAPVESAIERARQDVKERWKDQQLEALTNITTTVDVAQVNIQNSEVMRQNYIRAIESALGGYKFVPPDNTDDGSNHAIGGWEMHGGWSKVGELGPEYLYLPKGTGVVPANIVNAVSGVMPRANRDAYIPDTRQSSVTYFAPQNKTYLNYSIDARGATEPKRTREAVVRALTAKDIEKISKRRARETGGRNY